MNTPGLNNSTLRDYFLTCSIPQSAELATRLPDHLFRRSLTSPDEKFSVSRYIYSNTNADKLSDKKTTPVVQPDNAESCPNSSTTPKAERNLQEEADCMSEDEKLYLYKQLLNQHKHDAHSALVKHRRLMLDFQTRRIISRPDQIVLPITVLQNEGNFGLHGKIVHINQPINQVRNVLTRDRKDNERRRGQLRNISFNRPKSVPNNPTSQIRASFENNRPATSLNRPQHPEGQMMRKPLGSYLPLRYKSAGCRRLHSRENLISTGDHLLPDFPNDRHVIAPNKLIPREVEHGELVATEEDSSLDTFRSLNNDNSTPIEESNVLSLNVFLPREIEEVQKCNDPELQNPPNSPKKEKDLVKTICKTENIPNSPRNTKQNSKTPSLPYDVKELLAKKPEQFSSYVRFQYTHSRTPTPRITAHFKNTDRRDTPRPGLCSDCRTLNTRQKISRNIHYNFSSFASTLRLDGHKTMYI